MKYFATRRIAKNGNSYTIAVPRGMFLQMRLYRGQQVKLVYDDDTNECTFIALDPAGNKVGRGHSANDMRPML